MAVFPESMDRLDLEDAKGSLSKIQEYIRYMGERIDFSFRNMTKTVSAAGVSSAELYIIIQAQAQTLAALQSTVNSISGNVTTLQGTVSGIQSNVTTLQGTVSGIQSSITTIQSTLTSLDQRVTALEKRPTP